MTTNQRHALHQLNPTRQYKALLNFLFLDYVYMSYTHFYNRTFLRNIIFLMAILFSYSLSATEKQIIMGAGPSTALVTLFFKHFSESPAANGYSFEVEQRSIKHAGGILASDKYLFGRTGRPLTQDEKNLNKQEIFIARIPLTMVIGDRAGVKKITLDQLEAIITGKISNWRQLGGTDHKIILVGRENTEAALSALIMKYVFFSEAHFDRIFTRDHQVTNFITSNNGAYAISFGAGSNFDERYHLLVDGFDAGINLGLVYDSANASHPLIASVRSYAISKLWNDIVTKNGFLPADEN